MEIKEIGYENYGNCVEITNGVIDIVVTVDFGPRIVRFGFVESENVFYNDLDRKHSARFENFSALFGKNSVFYPYGGHRVWLSPAGAGHAGYPDNFSVVYSILPDSVVFTPPKQKHSDIQCGFEVVMGEDASDIMIIHTAKNYSKEAQTFGLWPITMVNGGGVVILPQNRDNSGGLEPNRLLSLWWDGSPRPAHFLREPVPDSHAHSRRRAAENRHQQCFGLDRLCRKRLHPDEAVCLQSAGRLPRFWMLIGSRL